MKPYESKNSSTHEKKNRFILTKISKQNPDLHVSFENIDPLYVPKKKKFYIEVENNNINQSPTRTTSLEFSSLNSIDSPDLLTNNNYSIFNQHQSLDHASFRSQLKGVLNPSRFKITRIPSVEEEKIKKDVLIDF